VSLNWQLESFSEADTEELVELCQAQAGKAAAVSSEYIRWQHRANPAGLAQVGLAKEKGSTRIIGVLWLMPMLFQLNGQVVLGSQSMYALVHPDFRRQGIFSALVNFCDEAGRQQGYRFSYGFPNPNSFPGFVNHLRWSAIGQARLFIRPVNTKRLIQRRFGSGMIQEAIAPVATTAEHLLFQPRWLSSDANQITVQEIDTQDTALDDFWSRVRNKYPVMVVRDTRFLEWRYRQIPDRHYQLWAAREHGDIVAIIALRCVSIKSIACGMLVDFLVEGSERGKLGGEKLIQHATDYFQQQNMDLAGCLMLPHVDEISALRHQGYLTCPGALQPQPFHVIFHMLDGRQPPGSLSDLGSWFLTMGDFDAV
jgi:GNAT superfamily N-acetyltransferase